MWDGTLVLIDGRARFVISIHPSRVGWDDLAISLRQRLFHISIHPSRVGWDLMEILFANLSTTFQSTHPVWDGTFWYDNSAPIETISIHPSRVGWDFGCMISPSGVRYFNPPIPCGMGLNDRIIYHKFNIHFNPPIPCGMGLFRHVTIRASRRISIHPSRVGWDAQVAAR